jgi:hypothetical protein
MKHLVMVGIGCILIASCSPADNSLPTLVPSLTPTALPPTSTASPSPVPTTRVPTATHTPTPTLTPPPAATVTPTPSATPTEAPTATAALPTANPTANAQASATALVIEAPRLATFTPVPPGVTARPTSTGTAQVIADVIIFEWQMQEEVDIALASDSRVNEALVDFTPEGVRITLSAAGGEAVTSGSFMIYFTAAGGGFQNFLQISADSSDQFQMLNGGPAPDMFVQIAYEAVVPAVFQSFDKILNQRLGQGRHDLERLVIDDQQMFITLYALQP